MARLTPTFGSRRRFFFHSHTHCSEVLFLIISQLQIKIREMTTVSPMPMSWWCTTCTHTVGVTHTFQFWRHQTIPNKQTCSREGCAAVYPMLLRLNASPGGCGEHHALLRRPVKKRTFIHIGSYIDVKTSQIRQQPWHFLGNESKKKKNTF